MRLLSRAHYAEYDLVALLDGELPLPERVAVERHLSSCERCAGLVERLQRAFRALAVELAAEPITADQESEPNRRLHPAVRVAGASFLAGSLGALVVAGMILRRHQHPVRRALHVA